MCCSENCSHHHVLKRRLCRPVRRHVLVFFANPVRARLLAKHHPVDALGKLDLSASDISTGGREQEERMRVTDADRRMNNAVGETVGCVCVCVYS